jgi:hypothetical protein
LSRWPVISGLASKYSSPGKARHAR